MKNKNLFLVLAATLPVTVAGLALATSAGANAADFANITTVLTDWLEGSLGTVLSLASLVVGLAIGVIQQSVIAAVIGISFSLVVAYGPTVINNISGAGLSF